MARRIALGMWLLICFAILCLVLVPGDVDEFQFFAYEKAVVRYGWPWTYCTREADCPNWRLGNTPYGFPEAQAMPPAEGFPLASLDAGEVALWVVRTLQNPVAMLYIPQYVYLLSLYGASAKVARHVREFSWLWLAVDLVVLSAILAAISRGLAWLLAQRRGWSITLRGWMVACTLLAIAGGGGIVEWRRYQRELAIATELEGVDMLCEYDFSGGWTPDWLVSQLQRMTHERSVLFAGAHVACVQTGQYYEQDAFQSTLETAARLPGLRMLQVMSQRHTTVVPMEPICQMRELEVLNLFTNRVPVESLQKLSSLPKLRVVRMWGFLPSDEELRVLKTAMPNVRFDDGSESHYSE